ncbi:MAG: alkaline phosphatase family protein [Ardenticatenales bacterium]|nr:alkaline phosphatase family protein [Ardenticatenales bacterium]
MSLDLQHLEADVIARQPTSLAALLPESFILPHYTGHSIANLPPTIGHLLRVDQGWAAPPLDERHWRGLEQGIERVILLVLDGIGWRRLRSLLESGDTAFVEQLEQLGARLTPITSVSPATTSVATTTLWGNGAAPAEHGILGFTMLLAEQSALCNMLFWQPVGRGAAGYGELESWGLAPETFLRTPSLAQVLAGGAVSTTSLMPMPISNSPLTRMQMRGARVIGYHNATDLWLMLRDWLSQTTGQRAFCYAYYPDFDNFSHRDGPNEPSWEALWRELRFHLDGFLGSLTAQQRQKTLFLVTADHGHVFSPDAERHLLSDHPALAQHLSLMPGGEPRHLYLYGRAGHSEAIRAYHEAHLASAFHLLDSREALTAGLYGPPARLHPDAERRLGDVVLLARGGATLWLSEPARSLLGMHGSLEAEEMLVPFLALRC